MEEKISEKGKNSFFDRIRQHPKIVAAVVIYLIAAAVLIGIVYVGPWAANKMSDVMTVEYGSLDNSQESKVCFVKKEAVYYADKSGKVGYSYGEGDMVRTGSTAVKISSSSSDNKTDYRNFESSAEGFLGSDTLLRDLKKSEKKALLKDLVSQEADAGSEADKVMIQNAIDDVSRNNSKDSSGSSFKKDPDLSAKLSKTGLSGKYVPETSGIISYKLDGYETVISPYTMMYLDRSKVSGISDKTSDVFTGRTTKGKPLFKIVDNREWYAVTWVEGDNASKFTVGGPVTLKLDSGEAPGSVVKVVQQDNDYLVIMKFSSYFDGLASSRTANCKIITSKQRGLIVKNDFISEKKGQTGVYVLDVTGKTSFTPVKVLANDGKYSLAASGSYMDDDGNTVNTINVYDEIKKIDK